MKTNFKEKLKFFGLSYFSDNTARTASKFGFGTLFLSLVLAFAFFLCGYMGADVAPFSTHYENAEGYKEFINAAFTDEEISFSIKNKAASCEKLVNTYINDGDKAAYAANGYNLIIDTRPSDTLVEFTQVAVKGEKEISYESYLALEEAEKSGYKLQTHCTGTELKINDVLVDKCIAYLNGVSTEGSKEYDAKAAAAYEALKRDKENYREEEYGKQLYYLYVKYYYVSVSSVLYGANAPVLRDYYYQNFIVNNAYYFYLFDDMCAGSFETDGGVPVVFGGYFLKCADGVVKDVDGLIKKAYYDTAGYTFTSYCVSAVSQLPFIIFIPLILALLTWGVGKLVKDGWEKSFTGCLKTVSAFIWFSALLTGVITFVLGFFVSARVTYSYMPLIFALLLLIRTAVFCVTSVIKNKKPADGEINNNDDIFGGTYET